jgi:hypothetical protein
MQHLDEVRDELPGLREELRALRVQEGHALVLADHDGAVPQDSDHGHADFRTGDKRLPVVDTEPHAEVKSVGEVLE